MNKQEKPEGPDIKTLWVQHKKVAIEDNIQKRLFFYQLMVVVS